MIFITGGRNQGKTAFAEQLLRKKCGLTGGLSEIADGRSCSMEEAENCRILVHAEQLLLRRSEYLRAPEELLKILSEEGGPEILCADEIGLGIVPADAGERAWRDAAGSFSQAAARRASSVYRIICGIPVCLKKEAGEDGDE